ncbi:MAG: iron-sulfur cluster assembly scaffold protein [Thermodesulfobacteriota bacterium]
MRKDPDELAAELQAMADADSLERFGPAAFDRWKNPRRQGGLPLPSAAGSHRDPSGRAVTISLLIENGRVVRAGWEGDGCGAFLTCCDAAAELAEGLTPAEAAAFDAYRIMAALPGLPLEKKDYAETAAAALRAAAEGALDKEK